MAEILFCGDRPAPGCVYCAPHFAVARREGDGRPVSLRDIDRNIIRQRSP
jgi:hypothetical protein